MDNKINVLIFPSEGMNAIELHDALSTCVNIKTYGASSVKRHGRFIFENYINNIVNINDESFIDNINSIINENKINVIFPTHDSVAKFLVENQNQINAKIISGDIFTVKVCRSKNATYNLFRDCDFIPKRYTCINEVTTYPLFSKPDEGQGAIGTKIINNAKNLIDFDFNNNILTEYLPGEEYTIDCLTDNKGNLRYISPRSRDRLMAGIAVAGEIKPKTSEIIQIAETINSRLHFLGLWYFQIKKDKKGKWKLLEISTRCAGTMCLTRAKGINLPLLSVYTAMDYEIEVSDNDYEVEMDRILTGLYNIKLEYNKVYIDFDDTITLNNKVNSKVIQYLYQCKNQNKEIILLTKHIHKIEETLNYYCISPLLFNKIITISGNDNKSIYIDANKSIFIDNAYNERKEVYRKHHIPVFDVDGVDFLIDRKY